MCKPPAGHALVKARRGADCCRRVNIPLSKGLTLRDSPRHWQLRPFAEK